MFPDIILGVPGGTGVKNLPANARDPRDVGSILGSERPPGVGNGNSSILAWEISCTEEPAGLQSTGLQSQTQLSACTHTQCTNGMEKRREGGKGSRFWHTAFLDSSNLFSP